MQFLQLSLELYLCSNKKCGQALCHSQTKDLLNQECATAKLNRTTGIQNTTGSYTIEALNQDDCSIYCKNYMDILTDYKFTVSSTIGVPGGDYFKTLCYCATNRQFKTTLNTQSAAGFSITIIFSVLLIIAAILAIFVGIPIGILNRNEKIAKKLEGEKIKLIAKQVSQYIQPQNGISTQTPPLFGVVPATQQIQ